jgi:delta(3,5)-delta(2,4)-dienoyl-CoA isomerase
MTGTDPARKALQFQPHILDFQQAISSIANCGVPVVSAVHAFCIGLGVDIISAGDIRVCAEDTKVSLSD